MNFDQQESIAIFIDGPNLYSSARALGFDIDYRKLLELFGSQGRLVRAFYYTALLEDQEYSPLRPLVDWLDYNGYTMVTKPAKEFTDAVGHRRIKGDMDIEIAVDMMEMGKKVDHIVLFFGDGDFRRLIEAVQREGVRVSVVSTLRTSTPKVADELRRQTDAFIEIQDLARPPARWRVAYRRRHGSPGMSPDEPAGRPPSEAASPESPRSPLPRRARVPASRPPGGLAPGADSEGKTLTIPRSISYSGRIGSCERLMVEGAVETEIHGCRALTIAASGVFRGSAYVERADISGTVEGSLTVRELPSLPTSLRHQQPLEFL